MPAQKRSSNHQQGDDDYSPHRQRRKTYRRGGDQASTSRRPPVAVQQPQQQQQQNGEEQQQEDQQPIPGDQEEPIEQKPQEDSDGSGTDPEDFDEVIAVLRSELRNNAFNDRHFFAQLFEARKDVECPICLGIIKKTRTVMGCLHRFCRECIDKSMRLGNNECPACRIHCASRRSLRDDVQYDALIEAIYPDVEQYEMEELVFREEDKTRNEKIQASIAEISKRQSEALNKRRKLGKDTDDISPIRVTRTCRNAYTRRRNNQKTEVEGYDGNERENDHNDNENPSPSENRGIEIKQRRRKRQTGTQPLTTSSSATNPDCGSFENSVQIRQEKANPLGSVPSPEILTWGRGGARSHTRHGGASSSRGTRGTRLSKLINHLDSMPKIDNESCVYLTVLSLDEERKQSLEKPFFCCQPSSTINQLRDHVAHEIKSEAQAIEMLSMESTGTGSKSIVNSLNSMDAPNALSQNVNWANVRLQILEGQETLAGLSCSSNKDLILAYGQKKDSSPIQLSPV